MVKISKIFENKISKELQEELLQLGELSEKVRILIEVEPTVKTLRSAAETLNIQFKADIVYQSKVTNYISMVVDADKVPEILEQTWVKYVWHVPDVELLENLNPEETLAAIQATPMETAEYIGVKRAKEQGY